MTKVCITSSRWDEIGYRCLSWAEENLPSGCEMTNDLDACDVFISVLYGHLVSEEFISKRRCYNFHPGILPQYRGAGAFSWAIINKEPICGVTLHELDVDIDTGPIIDTTVFCITSIDTAQTLFEKGMDAIYEMFKRWFISLVERRCIKPMPQGNGGHTYYRKDLKAVQDLTRFVRAFTFEGKEPAYYTDRNGNKIELRW